MGVFAAASFIGWPVAGLGATRRSPLFAVGGFVRRPEFLNALRSLNEALATVKRLEKKIDRLRALAEDIRIPPVGEYGAADRAALEHNIQYLRLVVHGSL